MIGRILSAFRSHKQTGRGRWVGDAGCHESKSHKSVGLRELDDGRCLIHCFGGCSVEEVLAAIGLTFSDLYPEQALSHHTPRERRPFNAHDILACIAFEVLVVHQCSTILLRGDALSAADHARLVTAAARIARAERIANGNH